MFVGACAAEHQMCVAIDEAGSHPGAAERIDRLGTEARKLGPLADAHDLAVCDPDRSILDQTERIARALFEGRDVAVDEEPVPHDLPLGEARCYGKAMSWPNLSDLLNYDGATVPIALLGAPLAAGSVTPGACDKAPELLRKTLKRIGRYDIEIGRSIFTPIRDRGDLEL